MSLRLGEPATIEPVRRRLESYPTLRFKLDPTNSWNEALVQELVDTGAVDSRRPEGHVQGHAGRRRGRPRRCTRWWPRRSPTPGSRILTSSSPELRRRSTARHDRITWDAPIHSVDDIEALQFPPKMVNIKPSRFGPLSRLFAAYDYCDERGIGAYGGGQFELGPGRGHIQYLASLFHPDTPNDVAPSLYNLPEPPPGLPVSPLEPRIDPVGFRWLTD